MSGSLNTVEAVATALAGSGLVGWALVQELVHRQVEYYSCVRWWEPPGRAFGRGCGYCVQYNGALASVLRRLGIECELVYAVRVRLADDPSWRMGHVWVRVSIDGESRDFCAGSATTEAGRARFEPVTKVRRFGSATSVLVTIGMAPIVVFAIAGSSLRRRPWPSWLHHPLRF